MSGSAQRRRMIACSCGEVVMEAAGEPIMTVACYCDSCQEAGQRFRALPGAGQIVGPDGGTGFVMFRKDRLRCLGGADRLAEYRLTPDSKTRRVIATCCSAPMFLEFQGGHWLSVYAERLPPAERPALELRTMTKYRPAGVTFDDGVPSPSTHSVAFMWRLLSAWLAMGFRAPRIDYVERKLELPSP